MKILAVISLLLTMAYAVDYPPGSNVRHWTLPSIRPGADAGGKHIIAGTTVGRGTKKYPHHFINTEQVQIEPRCVGKTLSIFPLLYPPPLVYTGGSVECVSIQPPQAKNFGHAPGEG